MAKLESRVRLLERKMPRSMKVEGTVVFVTPSMCAANLHRTSLGWLRGYKTGSGKFVQRRKTESEEAFNSRANREERKRAGGEEIVYFTEVREPGSCGICKSLSEIQ